jgi:uncharacterized protein
VRITAVLDTNVLAPGSVSKVGTSARLIGLWRAGAYDLVISEHLLQELGRMFNDPYYRARLPRTEAANIDSLMRSEAILTPIVVTVTGVATQPEDDLVIAAALSARATWLATRDRQLLKIG